MQQAHNELHGIEPEISNELEPNEKTDHHIMGRLARAQPICDTQDTILMISDDAQLELDERLLHTIDDEQSKLVPDPHQF
jgi:hypothetical protein